MTTTLAEISTHWILGTPLGDGPSPASGPAPILPASETNRTTPPGDWRADVTSTDGCPDLTINCYTSSTACPCTSWCGPEDTVGECFC